MFPGLQLIPASCLRCENGLDSEGCLCPFVVWPCPFGEELSLNWVGVSPEEQTGCRARLPVELGVVGRRGVELFRLAIHASLA